MFYYLTRVLLLLPTPFFIMSKQNHPLKNIIYPLPLDSHGYTGLTNLGNTCFLNSCIQVINHIYELTPIYETTFIANKKNDTIDTFFFDEWISLHLFMWKKDGVISPMRFVQTVQHVANTKQRELFTGFSQNDIHEFILLFIDTLHMSISRKMDITITGTVKNDLDELAVKCYSYLQRVYKNEYSEILGLFYGITVSKIISLDTPIVTLSTTPEHFFILDLPIPSFTNMDERPMFSKSSMELQSKSPECSLYDCLDLFTKEERLEGENAWFNEITGRKEAINKKIEFWNFPEILVISLKRFSASGNHKRNDMVNFPLKSLDLSRYVCGYCPNKYVYDLFGVCNHYGGCNGGHYTATVLNYLEEWVIYNDGIVERTSTNIVTPSAYCLFYRMKKTGFQDMT